MKILDNRASVLLFVACSMLFIFAIALQPAYAATYTVTTEDDELDASYATDCDPGNESDCSLREAIELSNDTGDSDTIVLPSGVFTIAIDDSGSDEDLNVNGDLDITQPLIITGNGEENTFIDGASSYRIFESQAGFSLSNVTVRNASGAGVLHAVSSTGKDLTIDQVTFSNNQSSNHSAVIVSNADPEVTISNSTFTGNSSSSFGAAITVWSAELTDLVFEQNTTTSSGAAVHVEGSESLVEIENAFFTENESDGYGSAIYCENAGSTSIVSSVVSEGVGLNALMGCAFTLDQVLVYENEGDALRSGQDITIINSALINNEGYGIREISGSTYTISNTILDGNESGSCSSDGAVASITSAGYNVDTSEAKPCGFDEESDMTVDPLFGSAGLADFGGSFDVLSIDSNSSPLIDAVPAANCTAQDTDIRGHSRPDDDTCDIGPYEFDQTAPTVTLDPGNVTLECAAESWSAPTATVSDNFDTTVTTASLESNNVDEGTAGSYSVVYASTADYDGNIGRASQPVTVEDTTVPVITVTETAVTAEAGETYTDSGASVADLCDEGTELVTSGTVDTDTLGEYVLTYSAVDGEENEATEKTKTVTVEDTTAPTITLTGESAVTLTVGDSYTDAGATATDSFEGTLTSSIVTTGSVDTDAAGTYTVSYNVSDSSGNAATAVTRTVTVEEAAEEGGEGESGESEEEPENDPETGDGDGTDDTEESLGEVVSLTKSTDSMVTVEYENGDTKTFQLFNASAKAKVQLHTNGEILIAINKRYMRTFDAFTGEKIDQVKLFKKKQYKTKFKRFNIYKKAPGKNNVMVLAQTKKKHKKQFKLRSFVVKNGGAITKRPYRTIQLNKNTNFSKLKLAKNNKNGKKARILVKRKGKTLKNWKYKVTKKKGILKLAS